MRFASCVAILLLLLPGTSAAITRGEFAAGLFDALGYQAASEPQLPPDVPGTHPYARQIGSAVRYGLLPRAPFEPDVVIDRHGAIRLAISMIGWDFEASLYESLGALPDFSGSGDSIFFMAAEMNPPAPPQLLLDAATPLSDTGRAAVLDWVRECAKAVSWNRVFSFGGTDFIIYRQGLARVGGLERSAPEMLEGVNPVGAPGNLPLYVAAVAAHMTSVDNRIAFATAFGETRAPMSRFADSYGAIAAVNAGFFGEGRPLGTMMFDGNPASESLEGRSAIGWNNENGIVAFGPGEGRFGLRTTGGFVQFDRFSVAPHMNEASFYPVGVLPAAPGTALDALLLAVRDGFVVDKREGSSGNLFLPEGGSLIVARGNSRAMLEGFSNGDPINIVSDFSGGLFGACSNIIQAGPMLLQDGIPVGHSEAFGSDLTDVRHPRTIVGTDGSRMIWAVIDGRSAVRSLGATMDETRWIARALGLTNAINMDGGGSSQLIWRGITTNMPSDGRDRPLPYVVMMMPKGAPLTQRSSFQEPFPVYYDPGFFMDESSLGSAPYSDTYTPYE